MLVGTLSPRTVRDTYLRGIDLGTAWQGPSADAAISALLMVEVSRAEALMNIHFHRVQIVTAPDDLAVLGQDYQQLAPLIPYAPPAADATAYELTLHYHDVQAVTQVRVYVGLDTGSPPAPQYLPVPLDQLAFSSYHERLYVPVDLVDPDTAQGWAIDYMIGLGMLPPEVVAWCAIGAAIEVLAIAGSGAELSHGLEGATLSMDGTEERLTYGVRGTAELGGMYAGPISILRYQREDIDLVKLRFRYQNTFGASEGIPEGALLPTPPYEMTSSTPRRVPVPLPTP